MPTLVNDLPVLQDHMSTRQNWDFDILTWTQ